MSSDQKESRTEKIAQLEAELKLIKEGKSDKYVPHEAHDCVVIAMEELVKLFTVGRPTNGKYVSTLLKQAKDSTKMDKLQALYYMVSRHCYDLDEPKGFNDTMTGTIRRCGEVMGLSKANIISSMKDEQTIEEGKHLDRCAKGKTRNLAK